MKGMKKLLSILMVLTLVLSLGATAFAATVTMSDEDVNSTFTAYPLLNATYDSATELYQYTVNETFLNAIQAGLTAAGYDEPTVSMENANKVIEAISKLTEEEARIFADAAFSVIELSETMKAAGVPATGKVFADLNGYYLIAETVQKGDEETVTSLVMLGTYGDEDTTVTTKEERPSSQKKVWEKNDTTGVECEDWQDGADWDIGDHVPFQLTGTLPGDYATYDKYKIVFHDQESKGLTFDEDGTITVACGGTSYTLPHAGFTVTVPGSDGCSFDIEITNVKETFPDATNGSVITVEYTSLLNEGAVIGQPGNPNTMYMEYSNDHYSEGTGKTPEDKVIVFTFTIEADKIDGNEEPLEGAGFTLLKEVKEAPAGTEPQVISKEEYEKLGDLAVGTYVTYDGKLCEVVHAQITGETTFTFKGQDSGKYLLVETTVPEGYNKSDDIEFTVEATYDTDADDPKLQTLTVTPADAGFTAELTTGIISGDIMNLTGVELPETGGIGTTIFYIVGAVLVAGAVILLVTKKRVSGMEK